MRPAEQLSQVLRSAQHPALVGFLTAGYPEPARFLATLEEIAAAADAVEIGVPFSDPMADGITIQRSSRAAIEHGISLHWILDQLAARQFELTAPVLLMSYLNPLLAYGYAALAARAGEVGVSGFIVPDLPYEESAPLRAELDAQGLALVQLVTPATPLARLKTLCAASKGFVYAVTRTGITGTAAAPQADPAAYLRQVKASSAVPVCAGFGVRSAADVERIAAHVDGVIIGSALIEVLEQGGSPGDFLRSLKPAHASR